MVRTTRNWVRDTQQYAVDQERERHLGALYGYGEWCGFVLRWHPDDHEKGLVARCSVCYEGMGEIADAYKQTPDTHCTACLGTTFEGGYRAFIIRPALWDLPVAKEERASKKGQVYKVQGSIQSTHDFRPRVGDIVIRADSTRWLLRNVSTQHLLTGFGPGGGVRVGDTGNTQDNVLGYTFSEVDLEDQHLVAYEVFAHVPPLLQQIQQGQITDWSTSEDIVGSLL